MKVLSSHWKVIWHSALFGILYWTVDSVFDAVAFHDRQFLLSLLYPSSHEFFSRLFALCFILAVSFFITYRLSKEENAFAEKERFLENVFSSIQDGISVLDTEMKIVRANPKIEEWHAHSMPLVGKKCYEAYHNRSERCEICPSWEALQTGKSAYEEVPLRDKEGAIIRWLGLFSFPIFDMQTGALKGVIEYVRDTTTHKQMEVDLAESEEKYRGLFEDLRDVVYISTPEGRIVDINEAGVKLLGYSSKEEIFKLILDRDVYVNPEDRKKLIELLDTHGFVIDFETAWKKKNSEQVIVQINVKAQKNDEGGMMSIRGVIRDITDEKKLRQQLLHSQKLEAIGQLAGGVAHDFNNILTAVIGYANLLKMKLKEDDPSQAYVDAVLSTSERGASLTHSLLTFGRKQTFDLRPVDLNGLIERVSKLLLRLIGEDIEMRTIFSEKDIVVMADSLQLEQILMNLATNARDAMPDGGFLTIETRQVEFGGDFVKLHSYMKPGRYGLVSFSDTGAGMDETTKSKIFEPFFTTKDVGKGTGLGLSIVYGIIKQHKGYINVYSEQGKGTVFKIYLPLAHAQKTDDAQPEQLKAREKAHKVILLGEDDNMVRKIIKATLEEFGYKVIEASNGEEAIDRFTENKDMVDLLLLDLIMPRKSGKEVFDEIKKIKPDIKAVFTSGYNAEIIDKKEIIKNGCSFITKPVRPADMLKIIEEALGKA